jgi:uncharacterized RDD family membrane protein YckC
MENLNEPKNVVSTLETRAQYAVFWRRFFAFIIDIICCISISAVLFMVPVFVMLLNNDYMSRAATDNMVRNYSLITIFVVECLYEGFLLSSKHMSTPGKLLFGMKVTYINGKRISFFSALLRAVTKYGLMQIVGIIPIIRLISLLCLLNPFLIALTEKKQAIHDYCAGTVVVRY